MKNVIKKISSYTPVLNLKTINQQLIKAEYQVRGGIIIRAEELRKSHETGKKMPFEKFVAWNIGNPQSLGQMPISFPREVISCLLTNGKNYSVDVIDRANTYRELSNLDNYTDFGGMFHIRQNVANFISKRDDCQTFKEDILLSNGASGGIKNILQILLTQPNDAILAPIPQYPLYSACIELLGSKLVGYYLDESKQWSVDINNLQEEYKINLDKGSNFKAMVIINPGNPTGNILSEENIREIIKFCNDNNLIILADEVYQNNIYSENKEFHSFKKVMNKMPEPYNKTILFSFNSVSKGFYGECGLRGGYTDMHNVPEVMKTAILNLKSLEICPNIIGQLSMDLLINPPNRQTCSEETVNKYETEVNNTFNNLKEKAKIMHKQLNSLKGMKCNEIEGAMYAFPSIELPSHIIKQANEKNMKPDYYYCLKLLEETGLITVPGSGFGQKDGTYHIRLTNLINPKEELIKTLQKIGEFNDKFL